MKEIKLTQGLFVQVDDWWFEELDQHKWYAHKVGKTYYARRAIYVEGKQYIIFMHREIMGTPDDKEVDHIDHNGLNCLEENMRNCTHRQNIQNRSPYGKSKYRGVKYMGKYIIAQIGFNEGKIYLGTFKTEEAAAKSYDIKAKELFGEYANLNFK